MRRSQDILEHAGLQPRLGRSLTPTVRRQIMMLIHTRHKLANGQLPSEEEMSKLLGISRGTLREVLVTLEADGLLVRKHGLGTFVRLTNIKDFDDLIQFRLMTELFCGAKIIERGLTQDELDEWRKALERTLVSRDTPAFVHYQFGFHSYLVSRLGNSVIEDKFLSLLERLEMLYIFGNNAQVKPEEEIYKEHVALISAVSHRDSEAYAALCEFHIMSAADIIRNSGAFDAA